MAAGHDEDAALMLRVQRGDLAAFETLVERHRQPVFNFILRTLQNPEDTEDLAQQVFVQTWKAAGRYRVTARFSTWLFTIARNLCLNELRRRGRHPTVPLDAPRETPEGPVEREFPGPDPEPVTGTVLLSELEARIEEALGDLPEAQRSAILLFREQDLSYDEIARVLGVSVSATKSLIHRGRETLKLRLKPYLRSGAWDSVGGPEPAPNPPATFPPARF
jgi:RNA polymerase sigma-70 factor (ECF subfamily)